MDQIDLLALFTAFFMSWQVKTLVGLILLDVLFGVACALRAGEFKWWKLAEFYRSMVVPYILGYLALYVAVGFIIPPGALGGAGSFISEATITMAWGALVITLLSSIKGNFVALYQFKPVEDYGPQSATNILADGVATDPGYYTQGNGLVTDEKGPRSWSGTTLW